jgi:two-component system response regulator HydG
MSPTRGPEAQPAGHLLLAMPTGSDAVRLRGYLADRGLTITHVTSSEAAVNVLDSTPVDLLVSVVRTARIQGLSLVALLRARNPAAGAALILGPGDEEAATAALAKGVVDFQEPPLNLAKLHAALRRVLDRQQLLDALAEADRRLDEQLGFPGLVGRSAVMARLRAQLIELAPLDAHVLVWGEPGAGKDLVAGILHRNSPRRNAPFVKIHCSALPPRLLAREIFGATRAAGHARHSGRVELAAGGTLYIDELAAVPPELQSRISDLLRTGQIRPALGAPPVEVDLRLIASASTEPRSLLDAGKIDEGLYELLADAQVALPPLRHRRRDIPLLARHFLARIASASGHVRRLEPSAAERLGHYAWPGNVGELRSVIVALAESLPPGQPIRASDLPDEIRQSAGAAGGFHVPIGTPLAEVERRLILGTLQFCGGNRARTAKMLGIGIRTLYRKLRAYAPGRISGS